MYSKVTAADAERNLMTLALINNGMAGGDGYKKLHTALSKTADLK